jgi:FKBP-type peptidyl-prolyl cis-trans isomerase
MRFRLDSLTAVGAAWLASALGIGAAPPAPDTPLPAPPAPAPGAKAPQTEDEKTLYALGAAISRDLSVFSLTEADLAWVRFGLSDGTAGRVPDDYLRAWGPKINDLARTRMQQLATKEKAKGAAFLEQTAATPGTVKLPNGILMQEIQPGTGANPKVADRVRVHYRGTLIDGKVFDSSIERGEPAEFGLDGVIPCWTQAVQQIKVGGKSRVFCPSEQAYQDMGQPPDIGPGATLIFEIELLGIVVDQPPPPSPAPSP